MLNLTYYYFYIFYINKISETSHLSTFRNRREKKQVIYFRVCKIIAAAIQAAISKSYWLITGWSRCIIVMIQRGTFIEHLLCQVLHAGDYSLAKSSAYYNNLMLLKNESIYFFNIN